MSDVQQRMVEAQVASMQSKSIYAAVMQGAAGAGAAGTAGGVSSTSSGTAGTARISACASTSPSAVGTVDKKRTSAASAAHKKGSLSSEFEADAKRNEALYQYLQVETNQLHKPLILIVYCVGAATDPQLPDCHRC